MNFGRLIILVLFCMAFSATASTADFFAAEIPVKSQSESDRARAAALGLKEVLVRMSGTEQVIHSSSIREALQRPLTHLEQFQYEQSRDDMGTKREYLVMSFNPSVVEKLLRDAQQPFWPTNRPEVLVWLVEDSSDLGKIQVNNKKNPMVASIQQAARVRGVPIRFPLLDLEDQMNLTAEQAWALDEDALLQAAARYKAETLLVGRYAQAAGGRWLVTWQFYHSGEWQSYEGRGDDVAALGYDAINPLADHLAGLYAVFPGAEDEALTATQVHGIESFRDFRRMLDYLGDLAVIGHYELVSVADDALLLNIRMTGSIDQLQNVLTLDGKMDLEGSQGVPQGPSLNIQHSGDGVPLRLRWIGGAG